MTKDICCYKNCKNECSVYYYEKPLCEKCWGKLSLITPAEVKSLLNIKIEKSINTNTNTCIKQDQVISENQHQ